MPQFERLSQDAFRRGRNSRTSSTLDLPPYRTFVADLTVGEGGLVTLEDGDQPRPIKRRLTRAVRERGLHTKWRAAPQGQLRFQLVEGQPGS